MLIGFLIAHAAPTKFDIPAQPAPAALDLFGKQAKASVAYSLDDLKDVTAHAVAGTYEPAAALDLLLQDTGFIAKPKGRDGFIVTKAKPVATTGSVKGSLTGEGGKGLANVLITIRETFQSAETDRYGVFVFPNVAAGTYVLVASAPGYQTMHITDVQVRAGRELTLGKEEMRKVGEGPVTLEPFVVRGETVEQLEKFEVTGTKQKPFQSANVDIPRTINDVQPYIIFDAKTIDQSGATSVDNFLKQRLTMNTVVQSNGQFQGNPAAAKGGQGNTSVINLRGLGTNETLILVNGRRLPGVTLSSSTVLTDNQPDLNGIPLSAIDHIEVLPSSASGIYGGSALGGVVNVVLKRDYVGGEVRATYANAWDTDSPDRTVSAAFGTALEGGKTHVMLSASWSDGSPLLLQDRRQILDRGLALILKNSPSFIYDATDPFLGALPNITSSNSSDTTLTLQNGTVLSSRNTFIPSGTSASTSTATLYTGLATNSGSWNFSLPRSTQGPTGLLQQLTATPTIVAFGASLRRQMTKQIEMFADLSYNENKSTSAYSFLSNRLTVPASAPTNPFTTSVFLAVPTNINFPITTKSITSGVTLGAVVNLPFDWTGEFDYTGSKNRFSYFYYSTDSAALNNDLASGAFNPFVDTILNPLNLGLYARTNAFSGSSTLSDFAIRGAGPLWALPWGSPKLVAGVEHRIADSKPSTIDTRLPITTANDNLQTFFDRKQTTDSIYSEVTVPLVKTALLPFVYSADVQLAGRSETYTVDAGTPYSQYFYNTASPNLFYGSPTTAAGLPFTSKAHYSSKNFTEGIKYQPVPDVTIRASRATAFLPPTPSQLVPNQVPDSFNTNVTDPKQGNVLTSVQTISGGNSQLVPQTAKSSNIGVIWEPKEKPLQGLRLDAEYYWIEQFNTIGSLTAQQIVNLESQFPGRVTRNASGVITVVDKSSVNIFKRSTEGWDLNLSYYLKTGVGTFSVDVAESIILHLKQQVSLTQPNREFLNLPAEGGAAKYKSNATVVWERNRWSAGWSTRYFGSYLQRGAPQDLISTNQSFVQAQGSTSIPSQIYHDLFVGYAFGRRSEKTEETATGDRSRILNGLSVQIGVKNVFNTLPPVDVNYPYYLSPYSDASLRRYWISLRKQF